MPRCFHMDRKKSRLFFRNIKISFLLAILRDANCPIVSPALPFLAEKGNSRYPREQEVQQESIFHSIPPGFSSGSPTSRVQTPCRIRSVDLRERESQRSRCCRRCRLSR